MSSSQKLSEHEAKEPKKPTAAQLGKIKDFGIPADEEDWDLLIKKAGLKRATINSLPKSLFASASRASEKQYAMLRSFSPPTQSPEQFNQSMERFGFTNSLIKKACHLLGDWEEWDRYLRILENDTCLDTVSVKDQKAWPGSLSVSRRLQEQTVTVNGIHDRARLHDPLPEPKRLRSTMDMGGWTRAQTMNLPDAEDEAIPNAAMIVLLQTVSHILADSGLEWVMNRVHFSANFKLGAFNAYTDGALRSKRSMEVFAITEAKKTIRNERAKSIFIQEACEVVGWLMQSSSRMAHFNDHFLVVSGDRHELFLTFAPYHKCLEDYYTDRGSSEKFLVMKTFGPWNTQNPLEMNHFAAIILAAILLVKDN